jgi:hypothetical protein
MKQTALEWLVEQLKEYSTENLIEIDWDEFNQLFDQAKEMEKEQIIDAFNNGEFFPSDYYHPNNPNVDGSETYYNETYGGENEI